MWSMRDRRDDAGGRRVDHVGGVEAGRRGPTSSSSTSAGVARTGRNAAAVVISKKVIGSPRIGALAALEARRRAASSVDERRRPAGCARGSARDAARCRRGRACPAASSIARMKATVEPLPLVPATWITGGRRRCGMAERCEQPLDAAERQIDQLGMQREQAREDQRRAEASAGPRVIGALRRRPWRAAASGRASGDRGRLARAWCSSEHRRASVARRSWRVHHHVDHAVLAADIRRAGSLRAASRGWSARSRARRRSRSARRARRSGCRRAWRRRR